MRILFINLPYHGHVIPTIGLVQELIKAGHQVTYLMPYDWEERIAESGAEFLSYEKDPMLDIQTRNAFISSGGPIGIFHFSLVGMLWTQDCVKGLGIRLKCCKLRISATAGCLYFALYGITMTLR